MKAFILLIVLNPVLVAAQEAFKRESFYSEEICLFDYRGQETTLPSGLRPDCETEFAVVEFDWAKSPKHYECIGQALVYSFETGKTPVCSLLARNEDEWLFAAQRRGIIESSGVTFRVHKLWSD